MSQLFQCPTSVARSPIASRQDIPSSVRRLPSREHWLKEARLGPRRQRGFTLIEATVSGLVIMALSTGLFMTLRYSQAISLGKAAGEQLTTINAAVASYMKQHGRRIMAINDPACYAQQFGMVSGETKPPDTATPTDCSLKIGEITVGNAYRPTFKELSDLMLVRGTDQLLLPFTPVVTDKSSGDIALARIAVWIRPVRLESTDSGSGSGNTSGGSTSTFAVAPSRVATANQVGHTRESMNLPPSLNGVNCYDGSEDERGYAEGGTFVFPDPADKNKVLPIYTPAEINAAIAQGKKRYPNGYFYCRSFYRDGFFGNGATTPPSSGGDTGGGGGGSTSAWTLEAITFNTQPYYYNVRTLPMGAAAQIGAALEATGFAGRLSMLTASQEASVNVVGLQGSNSTRNPIGDDQRGVPGILAAVSLMADSDQVAGGNNTTGDGISWDADNNNLINAGLLQGQQIAGKTAVVGTGPSIPTRGRSPVMAVNGDMVMGQTSTIMANQLEATKVSATTLDTSAATIASLNLGGKAQLNGKALKLGDGYSTHTVYVSDAAQVRLPRVDPGTTCTGYGDIAMSRGVAIAPQNNTSLANYRFFRFLLHCVPQPAQNLHDRGPSIWTSAEYEAALAKYPSGSYRWNWYYPSIADDAEPTSGF